MAGDVIGDAKLAGFCWKTLEIASLLAKKKKIGKWAIKLPA
jgi:hypothetical protein